MPNIKPDPVFRSSHKTGSLSPLRDPDDITALLGIEPEVTDPKDPDSDGKVTLEWRFTVDGKPCAIWDYKGVRWSTWGDDAVLAPLFSDYQAGHIRQSQLADVERDPLVRRPDFSRNRLARRPQNFDNSGLALFGDGHRQRDLF